MLLRGSLLLVALGSTLLAPPAGAFVTLVSSGIDGGRETFTESPRWDHFGATLMDHDRRTLGGGIEFSIADDLCERLLPRFRDRDGLTCHHLDRAIRAGLARWADGHPTLRFVDVGDNVTVALERAQGAELDFLALTSNALPDLAANVAWTLTYYEYFGVYGTHGKNIGTLRMQSADVVFDAGPDICYYYRETASKKGCHHFPSVALHEIGHSMGLGHPEAHRDANKGFHPDEKEPKIDCEDPEKGLFKRARLASGVVMRGRHADGTPVRMELSPDDRLGRDYLYPPCGAAPRPGFPDEGELPVRQAETDVTLPRAPGRGVTPDVSAALAALIIFGAAWAVRRRA